MEIDRNLPATKGDLEDFKVEVNTRFEQFEHRMEHLLLDMEGRLITSTYRLAESMNMRLKAEEVGTAVLKERMAIMETRITDIEKRINMPPGTH